MKEALKDKPIIQFKTPDTLKMPDLIGQTKAKAEGILAGMGFLISNVIYDFSNQPADIIFSQDPAPNADIDANTQITVYISKGIIPSGNPTKSKKDNEKRKGKK